MAGAGKDAGAMTRIEVVVVVAVCLVLIGSLIPAAMQRAWARSSRLNCTNNLKQMGLAFRTWAIDNQELFPMHVSVTNGGSQEFVATGLVSPHFRAISNELSTPRILVCPDGSKQVPAANWENDLDDSHISYFVGVDVSGYSTNALLAGDASFLLGSGPAKGLVRLTPKVEAAWNWRGGIHEGLGNILLADGRVSRLASAQLQARLRAEARSTNRLAVP